MNKYEVGQIYTIGHIKRSSTSNMYEGKLVEIKEIVKHYRNGSMTQEIVIYNFFPTLETSPEDREFDLGSRFDEALTLVTDMGEVELPTEIPNFKPVHDFNTLFGGQ